MGNDSRRDPAALESLIRRVVEETILQSEVARSGPGDDPTQSRFRTTHGVSLLKPREAAGFLAISERKLWDLTRRREIPHVRIDRAVRYDPEDLRAWVEGQKRLGTEEVAHGEHFP
jgi:excisionase family DNA binding protein